MLSVMKINQNRAFEMGGESIVMLEQDSSWLSDGLCIGVEISWVAIMSPSFDGN